MFFSGKQGVGLMPETLVKMLLLLAFLFVVVSLIFMVSMSASGHGMKKYSCWFTSSLKASDHPLEGLFPSACSVIVVDDALDTGGVAGLLRDTWWMYGHGKADYDVVIKGDIYEAARFRVSEKVELAALMDYLLKHRKGSPSSMEASDYNYLQEGAEGSTVCFDRRLEEDGFSFVPEQDYSLWFADSSMMNVDRTDKLVVMKKFDRAESGGTFLCYNPLTKVITTGYVLTEDTLLWGGWIAAE